MVHISTTPTVPHGCQPLVPPSPLYSRPDRGQERGKGLTSPVRCNVLSWKILPDWPELSDMPPGVTKGPGKRSLYHKQEPGSW